MRSVVKNVSSKSPGQTIDQPAQNQVGQDRQDEGYDDYFSRIHKVLRDNLVHDIQHDRENEHLADALPSVLEHVIALSGIRDEAPEVRSPASLGVSQPRANREDRGHDRLKYKSE